MFIVLLSKKNPAFRTLCSITELFFYKNLESGEPDSRAGALSCFTKKDTAKELSFSSVVSSFLRKQD
ncbi:hypothetical protein DWZ48_14915 [Hungatella hathewayi]|nr:hypothetical protein DWZ48_14915 [Hungatella hathewayi]